MCSVYFMEASLLEANLIRGPLSKKNNGELQVSIFHRSRFLGAISEKLMLQDINDLCNCLDLSLN